MRRIEGDSEIHLFSPTQTLELTGFSHTSDVFCFEFAKSNLQHQNGTTIVLNCGVYRGLIFSLSSFFPSPTSVRFLGCIWSLSVLNGLAQGLCLSGPGCSLVLLCACSCLMICFMLWVLSCLLDLPAWFWSPGPLVPWSLWPRPHATGCHCCCLPGRWLQCNM